MERVIDGTVHTITLENAEYEGENNAYLLNEGDSVTLVDTGVATEQGRSQLISGLAEHGLGFEDVNAIVLTHWHADHTGLAGDIQHEGGATVYVHRADADLVAQRAPAQEALRERQRDLFDQWGIPADKLDELLDRMSNGTQFSGRAPEVTPVDHGDRLDLGEVTFDVVHAPGHSAGLSCFEFDADGRREAFVGDALLPVYTPNVGGADVRVARPLEKYLETLWTIVNRDYNRTWPGHRHVIDAPTERARSIIDHHQERAERIFDFLDDNGPADTWETSAHLFGELNGIHILHGPGEAYAHLDHLERRNFVEQGSQGYRTAAPPSTDRSFLT